MASGPFMKFGDRESDVVDIASKFSDFFLTRSR